MTTTLNTTPIKSKTNILSNPAWLPAQECGSFRNFRLLPPSTIPLLIVIREKLTLSRDSSWRAKKFLLAVCSDNLYTGVAWPPKLRKSRSCVVYPTESKKAAADFGVMGNKVVTFTESQLEDYQVMFVIS